MRHEPSNERAGLASVDTSWLTVRELDALGERTHLLQCLAKLVFRNRVRQSSSVALFGHRVHCRRLCIFRWSMTGGILEIGLSSSVQLRQKSPFTLINWERVCVLDRSSDCLKVEERLLYSFAKVMTQLSK